jgi:NTE family protein
VSGSDATRPHVILVLGAGGPVGQAFHAGVLHALAEGCGWNPRSADVIIGTSAGAQVGALLRAGWDAHRLLQRATRPPAQVPHATAPALRWPASPAYLRTILRHPSQLRLGPLVAALLPEGRLDTAHLGDAFRSLFTGHWPDRPLWIPAVHVDSGARVVFGRDDAPLIDVGTAVRCSSAVPGLRRPVAVGAQRYVDGGMASPTHADLAAHDDAPATQRRLVIVLSPLSKFVPLRLLLRRELAGVRQRGYDVLLFEPDRQVSAAMGWNPMNALAAPAVADAAYRATLSRLQRADVAATMTALLGAPGPA